MRQLDNDRRDVDLALEIEGGLSAWELDFIESLNVWVSGGRPLTEKQREQLDEILERHNR